MGRGGAGDKERSAQVVRQEPRGHLSCRSEVSGGQGASPLDEAIASHRQNLDWLHRLIKDGKKAAPGDTRFGVAWPNSCEWLDAGKTTLHALTEIRDAAGRAFADGPGKKAMFGMDVPAPRERAAGEIGPIREQAIYLAQPTWLGFRRAGSPSKIVIIEPCQKPVDLIREIIVHEVQHDADHHGASDFDQYATELRAYWIDGSYRSRDARPDSADPGLRASDGTALSGFDNARQQHIFLHLYSSSAYPFVRERWHRDPDFRRKVLALTRPEGHNIINSIRLDAMYRAAQPGAADHDAFRAAMAALTPEERQAIRGRAMRGRWIALIDRGFPRARATALKKLLDITWGAA